MKKIVATIATAGVILVASAIPANAAGNNWLINSKSSSYKARYYGSPNCRGGFKYLSPGKQVKGPRSVTTSARSWYIVWSNGNHTSKLKPNYCVNLPSSATVRA